MIRYAITAGRVGLSSPEISPAAARRGLLERCAELACEGLDYLLLREKTLEAGALFQLTQEVVEVFWKSGTQVLVAQRPDIALAARADGVHLTAAAGELTAWQARVVFPAAIVSKSCHTLSEVGAAATSSVDLVLFGPVFGKVVGGVEVVTPAGMSALQQASAIAGGLPVLALGGVTAATAPRCMASGAAGVASIRMFFPES